MRLVKCHSKTLSTFKHILKKNPQKTLIEPKTGSVANLLSKIMLALVCELQVRVSATFGNT